MKIGICDDVSNVCDKIEDILEEYSRSKNLNIEVLIFSSTELIEEYLNDGNILDLIFLDIEFPDKSGIELANFIRKIKEDVSTEIVFVSGTDSHFKKLFEYQPIAFVSKPFESSDIVEAFEVFLKRLNYSNLKFSYNKGGSIHLIPYCDILCFECIEKKIYIYSEKLNDSFYGKISDLEKEIECKNFIRIHRSYIVNIDKVMVVKKDTLILYNNFELPIGRKYAFLLQNYFMEALQDG